MIFLAILDTVHALIGFLDVTASTVLLRVISFQNLPLNQTEAINPTNFLELSMRCLNNLITKDPSRSNSQDRDSRICLKCQLSRNHSQTIGEPRDF